MTKLSICRPVTTSDLVIMDDGGSTLTNTFDEMKKDIININEEIHDIRYPRRYGWSREHRKQTKKFYNKRWGKYK